VERIELTENELLQALYKAMQQDEGHEGYLTRRELQEKLGCSQERVYKLLDRLAAKGIEIESKLTRGRDRAGRVATIPAYRIKRGKPTPL
jgi:biotin operon repressor